VKRIDNGSRARSDTGPQVSVMAWMAEAGRETVQRHSWMGWPHSCADRSVRSGDCSRLHAAGDPTTARIKFERVECARLHPRGAMTSFPL
jgi:hypothetical protein